MGDKDSNNMLYLVIGLIAVMLLGIGLTTFFLTKSSDSKYYKILYQQQDTAFAKAQHASDSLQILIKNVQKQAAQYRLSQDSLRVQISILINHNTQLHAIIQKNTNHILSFNAVQLDSLFAIHPDSTGRKK